MPLSLFAWFSPFLGCFWQVITSGKAPGRRHYQNQGCTPLSPHAPLFW
jgi:hypothetical protein